MRERSPCQPDLNTSFLSRGQLSTNQTYSPLLRLLHNEATMACDDPGFVFVLFVLNFLATTNVPVVCRAQHCPAHIPVLVATLFLPSKLLPRRTQDVVRN